MTVKELKEALNQYPDDMVVLGEFDSDGDGFMVKLNCNNVNTDNGMDDTGFGDDGETYVILGFEYGE